MQAKHGFKRLPGRFGAAANDRRSVLDQDASTERFRCGGKREGPRERLIRFRGVAKLFQRDAAGDPDGGILRLGAGRLRQIGQCGRELFPFEADQPAIQRSVREARRSLERGRVGRHRFRFPTGAIVGEPEVEVAPRELRPQPHAGAEVRGGELMFARIQVAHAALEPRPIVSRVERDGPIEGGDRAGAFRRIVPAEQSRGEKVVVAGPDRREPLRLRSRSARG